MKTKNEKVVNVKETLVQRVYRFMERNLELFEICNLLVFGALLFGFLPWLTNDFTVDRVAPGIFFMACFGIVMVCFSVIPCYLLSRSDEWRSSDEDEDTEDAEQAKSDLASRHFMGSVSMVVSIPFGIGMVAPSMHYLPELVGFSHPYFYIAAVWIVLCSIVGYKTWKKIVFTC